VAEVRRTRNAKDDLKRIWHFIALDNPAVATKLLLKIERRLAQVAVFPLSGSPRPDVDPACRAVIVMGYRVLYAYDPVSERVTVVAVVEPQRMLPVGLGDLEE
jgi:toxin ParE1/3/4